ncbi:MAG: hypothetical protein WCI61_07760, partial [Chloroflexota bacterium]
IKDGATPVMSANEILEALNLTQLGAQMDFGRAAPPDTPDEQALMRALSREPQHIDVVARRSGLAPSVASGTLALLELKGLVRDLGGMQFVRVREDAADYGTDEATGTSATGAHGTTR